MSTRLSLWADLAWLAARATLLNRQNPMLWVGVAWWPGGRTRHRAVVSGPVITASTAAAHAPAAARATSNDAGLTIVSASSIPPPRSAARQARVTTAGSCTRAI